MIFYQKLRDLREDADMTQKQVADLIGMSVNHYGKYERGETDIPLEKAIILAKHYHVSLDYLAGLTNVKNPGESKEESEADILEILGHYISLSEHNRKYVNIYISKMAKAEKE